MIKTKHVKRKLTSWCKNYKRVQNNKNNIMKKCVEIHKPHLSSVVIIRGLLELAIILALAPCLLVVNRVKLGRIYYITFYLPYSMMPSYPQ